MLDPELLDDEAVVDARTLRQFAALWLLVLAGFAGWNVYEAHRGWAVVFISLALAVGPLGLIRPSAVQPLFAALVALTKPIGIVMTRVILATMFYVLFTPIAVVFKIIGRDALNRHRGDGQNTYWLRRSRVTSPRRYFQQY